jgi:hypothetical protein
LEPIINIDVSVMVGGIETAVAPEAAATEDADVDTAVMMEFGEAILNETLVFTLEDEGGNEVTGAMEYNATSYIITFTPDSDLAEGENYTLTITDSVENLTNVAILPRDVTWQFNTMLTEIFVTATFSPADGDDNQELDVEVKITFSHEMNKSATEAAITAAFGTNFTWSNNGKSVVIEHDDFSYDTPYTV